MPNLTEFSDRDRTVAFERYQKLAPYLEQKVLLTQVAANMGIPIRTASRWANLYRKFGLVGLMRRDRYDQGKRRALSKDLGHLVEGLALQRPPLGHAAIYREICRLAEARGEKPPGYHTVYRTIKALPDALTTLATGGDKVYRETYDLIHRREAEGPNHIWQADHTQLDLWAISENGAKTRPWLTIIMDDYSRAIAGFYFSFNAPSAIQTALALRQAIWRKPEAHWSIFGIPEILYTDNGSDFTSVHLEQVAADIKIRLVFSTPGNPRGRGRIERFFKTVNQMFLCTLPGYTEGGVMRGKPTLTLADLDRTFRDFLQAYHTRIHSQTKISPLERWQHGGFLPRIPESLEQLDLLLLTVAQTRKVQQDGIRFQGMRYIDSTLAAYVGESVILRYDPRDMAEVRLFYQGKFLCRAICPELAGQTVPLRNIRQARDQRRHELKQTLRERKQTVEALFDLRRGEPKVEVQPEEQRTAPARHPKLKRYHHE